MWCILLIILIILIAFLLLRQNRYTGSSEIYEHWQKDSQIKTLFQYPDYKHKLLNLLLKVYQGNKSETIINIINENETDTEILNKIKAITNFKEIENRAEYQANQYYEYLKKYPININNYLDVGCDDASVTKALAKLMNAKNKYCIDVKSRKIAGIKYHQLKDTVEFPYKDKQMDLITCFMVLHHIKNLDQEMTEIARVLRPNGLLYVREHDCWNGLQAMLIDMEHRIYINAKQEPDLDPYMYHYKNYKDWIKYIERFGFRLEKMDYYGKYLTNTRSFYMIFRKT